MSLAANLGPITGKGVGVAVIDSGVANLPQLGSRVVLRKDFTGSKNVNDEFGHGTHIAGIIAGGRPGRPRRRAWRRARTSSASRCWTREGNGKVSDVIEAIDWAIARTGTCSASG